MIATKLNQASPNIVVRSGLTRKEAARFIAAGHAHVHSTKLEHGDPLVGITQAALEGSDRLDRKGVV